MNLDYDCYNYHKNGNPNGNKIVLLTKDNADKIENKIKIDDDYFPFSKNIFDFYGTQDVIKDTNRALFAVVRMIDRDNNTGVWRYGHKKQFYKMIDYIKDRRNNFFNRLNDQNKGDTTLPDEIVVACGTEVKSLSSKVCKYLCEFIYQGDNYYINDRVVRHILLFYLDYYGVQHNLSNNKVDELSYVDLYSLLTKLHNARNAEHNGTITKSQLDHILWYCYKSFDI